MFHLTTSQDLLNNDNWNCQKCCWQVIQLWHCALQQRCLATEILIPTAVLNWLSIAVISSKRKKTNIISYRIILSNINENQLSELKINTTFFWSYRFSLSHYRGVKLDFVERHIRVMVDFGDLERLWLKWAWPGWAWPAQASKQHNRACISIQSARAHCSGGEMEDSCTAHWCLSGEEEKSDKALCQPAGQVGSKSDRAGWLRRGCPSCVWAEESRSAAVGLPSKIAPFPSASFTCRCPIYMQAGSTG